VTHSNIDTNGHSDRFSTITNDKHVTVVSLMAYDWHAGITSQVGMTRWQGDFTRQPND